MLAGKKLKIETLSSHLMTRIIATKRKCCRSVYF
jgi:hypothetical protein